MRTLPVCLFATVLCAPVVRAELLPPDRPMAAVVDHYLDAELTIAGVKPAQPADDVTLIRRLTLDLAGRIPTAAETQAFLKDVSPSKRVALIDRLMASPAFTRHQVNELDTLLSGSNKGSLREYLAKAVQENRSWEKMFRELLIADESDPARKGATGFLKGRVSDLDRLTAEVSSLFFGVNVSGAQCHDHPLVPDWKQDHFYGMKSFFSRTYEVNGFLAEREYGTVKFKTTKGEDKKASMMFLTGKVADLPMNEATPEEQKREKELMEKLKKEKKAPPAPKVSARAKLVELSLQPGQREFFARAIVNRVWYRLFGQGLVMPLDQMHTMNPSSHPELIEWLARDTASNGYDLRRVIRGLVQSKAYARSSRWEHTDSPPSAKLFAVAKLRPLTPPQLGTAARQAVLDPKQFPANLKPEAFDQKLQGIEGAGRGLAGQLEQPTEDFQIGVGEALLFSNGNQMRDLLSDGGDRLIGQLKLLKEPREQVTLAIRTVLIREPLPEEMQQFTTYLAQRADRPVEAYRQLVWALLSSAEFRFNY